MFSEKLDFLMSLTATSNSALSRAVNYDQSYISKIRSGKRRMPRHREFFDQAVPYFVHTITTDKQKKIISDVILGGAPFPENRRHLELILGEWLRAQDEEGQEPFSFRLRSFSNFTQDPVRFSGKTESDSAASESEDFTPSSPSAVLPFYGNVGKRKAVELFLTRLCRPKEPRLLLLYSDEEMSWLTEDRDYIRLWTGLMTKYLSLGGRIQMIHTINRNVSELMSGIRHWIPIYLTGKIESFYCPRLRDGIFHRSLFVAPGHSALVSSSVSDSTEGMANLFFCDPLLAAAFEKEFLNYLALCRPLTRIYQNRFDRASLEARLALFGRDSEKLFLLHPLPFFGSLPNNLLSAAAGDPAAVLFHEKAASFWQDCLDKGRKILELLHLPDPSAFQNGRSLRTESPLPGFPSLSYTADTLARHLKALLILMEENENYTVLPDSRIPMDISIAASEQAGVILFSSAPVIFSMEEPMISAAIQEYLERAAEQNDREASRLALIRYIDALQTSS
ncbi:MAG: hypothetical protein K6E30_03255 [Lachnospiraceae bacterium]|nr:hypothetical protein [Lachnospiraceae bacterium]